MKLRPSLLALSLCASIAAAAGFTASASAAVQWNVSVNVPAPMVQTYSVVSAQAYPQAYPVTALAPAQVSAPIAPAMPSIEDMQAQQQARIQWGAQVGLITPHEHFRLQQTQQYIEEQRRWAYADGWLTYDEHVNLIHLLNGASQEIERKLTNWQRVQNTYYPMPPALTYWTAPRYQHYGRVHQGHAHQGHGQQQQPAQQGRPAHVVTPLPPAPPLPPLPPLPPSPHKVLKHLREQLEGRY
jgi:hypothetical protein